MQLELDIEKFHDEMIAEYMLLNEHRVAIQPEIITIFNKIKAENPGFVQELEVYNDDLISTDREKAAFVNTLVRLVSAE